MKGKKMNKDKLILKDETVVEMESGASLSDIKVVSDNKAAMMELWDKLTEDNLAKVTVKNSDGVVVGRYSDLILVSETSTIQGDGTVITSFNLREKTDTEKRLDAMESSQQTQDEAIGDLGQAVSDLAEGGV
jgi:hypothetical protein